MSRPCGLARSVDWPPLAGESPLRGRKRLGVAASGLHPELFEAIAQGAQGDAEEPRGAGLVAAGLREGAGDALALQAVEVVVEVGVVRTLGALLDGGTFEIENRRAR